MIFLKNKEEIEKIRTSCDLVSRTIAEVGKHIRPGISTLELDKIGEEYIRKNNAEPAFLGYKGFPNSLCISVNEEVVHGIPNAMHLKEGDIVSVDCGVKLNGWFGDSAYTFTIGEVSAEVKQLLHDTQEALRIGVALAQPGKRIGDISFAIQEFCEKQKGYGVVRELVGHGIGKKLHEDPEVPNFGKRGQGPKMSAGMVIAIEPMINMGTRKVYTGNDKWTIYTEDNKPSAHFEHTICVTQGEADVLTTFKYIEEVIQHSELLTMVV